MNEDVNDPAVSQRYREIATEKAPDRLNQSVLREARRQSGSRYTRTVFWLRPMAWAASIGLCLAIVVELNNVPRPEVGLALPASVPAPARTTVADEEARVSAQFTSDVAKEVAQSDAIAEPESDTDSLPERVEPEQMEPEQMEQRARKSVDEDGQVSLDDLAQLEKFEVTDEIDADRRDDFTAQDTPIVEETEALGRMREGDNVDENQRESKQTSAYSFAASAAPAVEMAFSSACSAVQRETPEDWLECIQGLETDGMAELAALEREHLIEAYPEFEMP